MEFRAQTVRLRSRERRFVEAAVASEVQEIAIAAVFRLGAHIDRWVRLCPGVRALRVSPSKLIDTIR